MDPLPPSSRAMRQESFLEDGCELNIHAREFVPAFSSLRSASVSSSNSITSTSPRSSSGSFSSSPPSRGSSFHSSPPTAPLSPTSHQRYVGLETAHPATARAAPKPHMHMSAYRPAPEPLRVQHVPEHAAYMPVSRATLPVQPVYQEPHQIYAKHPRTYPLESDVGHRKYYSHIPVNNSNYARQAPVIDSREHQYPNPSNGSTLPVSHVLGQARPADPADFIRRHYAKMSAPIESRSHQHPPQQYAPQGHAGSRQQQWVY
mmetsp:Transcript_15272/g.22995  ORF Transcript_15272/g.22995 Transcript_15272/m.22995 type:complete len:260 (-) Transcript_15272:451-1230(-)